MDNAVNPSDALKLFVRDYMKPYLKEAGFSKKGMDFHRQRSDIIDVIQVQASNYNDWGNSTFFLNYGMDSIMFWTHAGRTMNLKPDYTTCLYSHRLHEGPDDKQNLQLIENGKAVDFSQFSKELFREIQQLLNHFEQVTTPQQLVALATDTQGLQNYEDICRYLANNHDEEQLRKYIARLHTMLHENSRWPYFSVKIAAAIGKYANDAEIKPLIT